MSLATLLSDFARLLTVEAERVHPKPELGEPDHDTRWSRNDRRHMLAEAERVRMRLARPVEQPKYEHSPCDCPTCAEVWQR